MKIFYRLFFCALFLLFLLFSPAYSKVSVHYSGIRNNSNFGLTEERKANLDSYNISYMRASGMQASKASPSGKFLIHFDTLDTDSTSFAVPPEDDDNNGCPDYVDSVAWYFDYVYSIEVEQMGYKSPIPEPGGKDSAYDVYLLDIGYLGWYGMTYPANQIPYSPARKYSCYYSYIVIDNDFSEFDSCLTKSGARVPTYAEPGIAGMKITAAHEFYHAIQNLYGSTKDPLIHEMASSYMEIRVFPDTKDYYQFLKDLFWRAGEYPFGEGSNFNIGYRYGIYGLYLYKRFGDIVLRRMWEHVFNGENPYLALDSSLKELNSSFDSAWEVFLTWMYYTGPRAIEGKYFEKAGEYPQLKFSESDKFSKPSLIYDGTLKSFEIRAFRYFLPGPGFESDDTLDLIISNRGIYNAVTHSDPHQEYTIILRDEEADNATRLGATDYFYNIMPDTNSMFRALFHNMGIPTAQATYAYPNPFRPETDEYIFFPVPENVRLNNNASLTVYDANMSVKYSSNLAVEANINRRGVYWKDIPEDIGSGFYIFTVSFGGESVTGKFAVKR